MVVASQPLGEEAKGRCCLMGRELQFYEMQKVLEICFTTMQIFSTLLNCALKTVSMVGFTMCVLFHTHKAKKLLLQVWHKVVFRGDETVLYPGCASGLHKSLHELTLIELYMKKKSTILSVRFLNYNLKTWLSHDGTLHVYQKYI